MFILTNMNAQNIFQDNFNSYPVDTDVTTLGYTVLNGLSVTVQAADATNNNGSQFIKVATTGASNINVRTPEFTLVEGKTYMFEVMTFTATTKNRTPYVYFTGGRTLGGTIVNAPEWTKSSYSFTVNTGESAVKLAVISQEKTIDIFIDDFVLYEFIDTAIPETQSSTIKIVKNLIDGAYRIISEDIVSGYEVYNTKGQLVKNASALNVPEISVNLSDMAKGVYLLKVTDGFNKTFTQKVTI
jgi:hypothetical protein